MSDLIDRQALMDAFECLDLIDRRAATKSLVRPRVIDPYEEYWTGRNDQYNADVSALKDLPSAEPERKTGRWIHVTGYCTPGGDPVWACSECGKGEHVYGIEYQTYSHNVSDGQWVSCPNCGADMRGGEHGNKLLCSEK